MQELVTTIAKQAPQVLKFMLNDGSEMASFDETYNLFRETFYRNKDLKYAVDVLYTELGLYCGPEGTDLDQQIAAYEGFLKYTPQLLQQYCNNNMQQQPNTTTQAPQHQFVASLETFHETDHVELGTKALDGEN